MREESEDEASDSSHVGMILMKIRSSIIDKIQQLAIKPFFFAQSAEMECVVMYAKGTLSLSFKLSFKLSLSA